MKKKKIKIEFNGKKSQEVLFQLFQEDNQDILYLRTYLVQFSEQFQGYQQRMDYVIIFKKDNKYNKIK